jgi:hypothetical protein
MANLARAVGACPHTQPWPPLGAEITGTFERRQWEDMDARRRQKG